MRGDNTTKSGVTPTCVNVKKPTTGIIAKSQKTRVTIPATSPNTEPKIRTTADVGVTTKNSNK